MRYADNCPLLLIDMLPTWPLTRWCDYHTENRVQMVPAFLDAHCEKKWAYLGVKFWENRERAVEKWPSEKVLESVGKWHFKEISRVLEVLKKEEIATLNIQGTRRSDQLSVRVNLPSGAHTDPSRSVSLKNPGLRLFLTVTWYLSTALV